MGRSEGRGHGIVGGDVTTVMTFFCYDFFLCVWSGHGDFQGRISVAGQGCWSVGEDQGEGIFVVRGVLCVCICGLGLVVMTLKAR